MWFMTGPWDEFDLLDQLAVGNDVELAGAETLLDSLR